MTLGSPAVYSDCAAVHSRATMRIFHTRFPSPFVIAVLLLFTLAACGEPSPGVVQFEARATPEGPSTPTHSYACANPHPHACARSDGDPYT